MWRHGPERAPAEDHDPASRTGAPRSPARGDARSGVGLFKRKQRPPSLDSPPRAHGHNVHGSIHNGELDAPLRGRLAPLPNTSSSWSLAQATGYGRFQIRNDKWRWLAAFLVPQAVSLYLTALYNFAITGSVRPDALFLAWGPGGVTTARMGQGLLGILLDARYGILPYVPLLVLAVAGLVLGGARRFAVVLPAAAVYYLTVASADNWAGAVCNLGRYFMPVAPLAIALVAMAITRASRRRGALALALILAGWSALFAVALWHDPHAANDSALLLAQSTYADGNQYIPNLFLRRWSDGAPGLWVRIGLWMVAIGVAAVWWRRAAAAQSGTVVGRRGTVGASPSAVLGGTLAVLLAFALTLEQWPTARSSPFFGRAVAVGAGAVAFARGGGARAAGRGDRRAGGGHAARAHPRDRVGSSADGRGRGRPASRGPAPVRPAPERRKSRSAAPPVSCREGKQRSSGRVRADDADRRGAGGDAAGCSGITE